MTLTEDLFGVVCRANFLTFQYSHALIAVCPRVDILDGSSKAAKEADLGGQPPIELVGNTTQQLTQPKNIAKKAEAYQNVEVRESILLAIVK